MLRVRTLLGSSVADRRQDPLGEIEDLLFHEASGRVDFLAVAPRGEAVRLHVPRRRVRCEAAEGPSLSDVTVEDVVRGLRATERRDQDRIFASREATRLSGRVTEVCRAGPNPHEFVLVKLREENNHLHRVLLAPDGFLQEHGLAIEEGSEIELEAVATRDARGRIWIAGQVSATGSQARLRDASGEPRWGPHFVRRDIAHLLREPTMAGRTSVRELLELAAVDPEGRELECSGLVLDRELRRVRSLLVRLGDDEHAVPWKDVRNVGPDQVRLRVGLDDVAGSPALVPGCVDDPDFWDRLDRDYARLRRARSDSASSS